VADEVTRSAAKLATLVAVPLALVVGAVVFLMLPSVMGGADEPGQSTGQPAPAATTPVATQERTLTEREETVCRALLSQLPQEVRGLPQRPVTDGPEQNTAYGEPPITVECGTPPAEVEPTDTVWPLDGVCYHATERQDASVWITLDREVPVRITVPDGYDGPGQWVAEFSATVVSTVLSADTDDIPTGCRS
jgi:hypothetical protein